MGLFSKLFGSQSKVAAAADRVDAFAVKAAEKVKEVAEEVVEKVEETYEAAKEEVETVVENFSRKNGKTTDVTELPKKSANSSVSEGRPANTGPTSTSSGS